VQLGWGKGIPQLSAVLDEFTKKKHPPQRFGQFTEVMNNINPLIEDVYLQKRTAQDALKAAEALIKQTVFGG
jgi:hypothetical protein